MASTRFPLQLQLRIDWSEMDLYGHVNNVSYFKYMQAARVNYWETLGLNTLFEEQKLGPILASSTCDFKRPLHYPGHIVISSGVESIGASSFTILHRIFNSANELAAEAKDVIVMFDFNKNVKMAVPDSIRTQMEEMEQRKLA
jgi:acyl-CoA thioester hydrolase